MALRQKKRPQRPARRIELVRVVPQAQEDLLDDVLGLGGIAGHPSGKPAHCAGVAPVQLRQRLLAVAADGHHQLSISEVGEVAVSIHRQLSVAGAVLG